MTALTTTWKDAWHKGFAPNIETVDLERLAEALRKNDPRIIQGATTDPHPLALVSDWPVDRCCPVAFVGAFGSEGKSTVGQVEERFARLCYDADRLLGEPGGCRHLLNAIDEWTREELLANLLPEVLATIASRKNTPE